MGQLRRFFEYWKHFNLRNLQRQVTVATSTRLLRRFSVKFLAGMQNRVYLSIGENCMLNAEIIFESLEGEVRIGNRTYIGNDTSIISRNRITIGNDVTMAWGIMVYDHNSHSFDWRQRANVVKHFYLTYGTPNCFEQNDWSDVASAPITISDRAWVGFGAVILKGVTIGEGAVVGACSVVTRNVEPYTVVAGNPAVLVRRLIPPLNEPSNQTKD